jgi:RNA polymerase sporulation-specific sigma factor
VDVPAVSERTVEAHVGLAYTIADTYYLPGAERDDLRQEALIGLWNATLAYQPHLAPAGFIPFARLCIERHVLTAVKNATRRKHLSLTRAAREGRDDNGELLPIIDLLPAPCPFLRLDTRDEVRALVAAINTLLSAAERSALIHVVNGDPYAGDKTVDNAVQRARVKLRAAA